MSKAYRIDKDGIIVEVIEAFFSYKYPGGKVIKPKSEAEDRALVAYSNQQKKIKALQEQMRLLEMKRKEEADRKKVPTEEVEEVFAHLQQMEHETYAPGQLTALMEQWRSCSAVLSPDAYIAAAAEIYRKGIGLQDTIQKNKMEHLTQQNDVMQKLKILQDEIYAHSLYEMEIDTEEGKETVNAQVDLFTNGSLTEMEKQIDAMYGRIFSDDPAGTSGNLQTLEAMTEKLKTLSGEAKRSRAQYMGREDEMQRIAQRLEDSSWELLELKRGENILDDCWLLIQNSPEQKATIRFCIDGTVEILSQFQEDAYQTRAQLQNLVLDAVQENGEKAKGKCMDNQPGQVAPEQKAKCQASEPDSPAAAEKMLHQTGAAKQERSEHR